MAKTNVENNVQTKTDKIEKVKMPGVLKFFCVFLFILPQIATIVLFVVCLLVGFRGYDAPHLVAVAGAVYSFLTFLLSVFVLRKVKKKQPYLSGYGFFTANIVLVIVGLIAVSGLYIANSAGVFGYEFSDDSSYSSDIDWSYNSHDNDYDYDSGKKYGAGGYEMPNENDDSVADYIQRVDPELYDSMQDRYYDAVY